MAFDLDSMFFSFGNVHIISGHNGMCECGMGGKTCYEQLASVASKYMELNATSTNSVSPKLPGFEEIWNKFTEHWYKERVCTPLPVARQSAEFVYEFIARQLRA